MTCLPSLLQSEIDSPSLDTLKKKYGFMSLRRCWIKNSGLSHQEILDLGHSFLTLGYSIKPFYLYETKFISLINMELDNIKGFPTFNHQEFFLIIHIFHLFFICLIKRFGLLSKLDYFDHFWQSKCNNSYEVSMFFLRHANNKWALDR